MLLQTQIYLPGGRFDYHLEYEHLREYGIRLYCSKLGDEGWPFEEIIKQVRVFARYGSDKDAEKFIEETTKYTPNQYEEIYRIAIKLGNELQILLNKRSAIAINSEWPKFIAVMDMLKDSHKSAFRRKYKNVLDYETE